MARPVPDCPNCGEKLPYDSNARTRQDGDTEHLDRFRNCPCGYSRHEKVTTVIRDYFPESHVCDEPKHPGEGGSGYLKR